MTRTLAASLLAFTLLMGTVTPGHAMMARDLDDFCHSPLASREYSFCEGFVAGFAGGWQMAGTKVAIPLKVCAPAGVPLTVFVDIVKAYLQKNPPKSEDLAVLPTMIALHRAYPCPD